MSHVLYRYKRKTLSRDLLTFQGNPFQHSPPHQSIPVLVQKTVSRHLRLPTRENKRESHSLTLTRWTRGCKRKPGHRLTFPVLSRHPCAGCLCMTVCMLTGMRWLLYPEPPVQGTGKEQQGLPLSLVTTLHDHKVPSTNTETLNAPSVMTLPSCSSYGWNSDILFTELQGHWVSCLQFFFNMWLQPSHRTGSRNHTQTLGHPGWRGKECWPSRACRAVERPAQHRRGCCRCWQAGGAWLESWEAPNTQCW